jgi:hypothetical protein
VERAIDAIPGTNHSTHIRALPSAAADNGHSIPPQNLAFDAPATDKYTWSIPPAPVLRAVVDAYFEHVQNQPYSYFHEASFRQKLENNLLPRCLVFAVLASGVRFSTHPHYTGRTHEATEAYARESWLSVITEHLTVEDNMGLPVVQTILLLTVVDYTGTTFISVLAIP